MFLLLLIYFTNSFGEEPVYVYEEEVETAEHKCQQNFVEEWYLNKSAYLNQFINQFWRNEDKLKETAFTTEYGQINPVEDMAESFAAFILKTNKPQLQNVADRKIAFFYGFPEFTKLRKDIRKKLSLSIRKRLYNRKR